MSADEAAIEAELLGRQQGAMTIGIAKQPIETAPQDGTAIFAWDGKWWRDLVRWCKPIGGGPEGWYFQRSVPIHPTHWYPVNEEYDAVLAEVAKGYRPA